VILKTCLIDIVLEGMMKLLISGTGTKATFYHFYINATTAGLDPQADTIIYRQ
jgi:hypothetical protein